LGAGQPFPTIDAWGRPYTWSSTKREYCIASAGSDGSFEWTAAQALATTRKRYCLRHEFPRGDVVFCTGSFMMFDVP
jgi:hypothetical protein